MICRPEGLLAAAVALGACGRSHHEPAPAPPPPPAPAAAQPHSCTLLVIPLKVTATARVVAIGDLHGDFGAARDVLRAAGLIDAGDHWSGGSTTLVQTGDVLDRGDGETKILALFDQLAGEAKQAGGQVVQLLGNHELMNGAHDFRYVTPAGMKDFDGDRAHELGPGGVWAKRLATHNMIALVGDTLLSHAGVVPEWTGKLDAANLEARCWLAGEADAENPPSALTAEDSPVWTRAWGGDAVDCAQLRTVLDAVGAKRMVVGHTVQATGINSQCDGALWRIDVGLDKLYGGPIEALQIAPETKIITGARTGS